MKKIWLWILGVILVVLIIFLVLFMTGFLRFPRYAISMMNDGSRFSRDSYWFQRDFRGGMHGFPFFGAIGMLLMLALPVGFVALLVAGIILLVQSSRKNDPTTPKAIKNCGNCGKPVDKDWQTCPYCGEPLRKE